MSETDTVMNLMFKSANMILDNTNFAIGICDMIVKPLEKDPVNAAWKQAIDEGKVNVISVSDIKDEKKELLCKLDRENIPYKEYNNMIFTLNDDKDHVEDILNDFDSYAVTESAMQEHFGNGFVEVVVDTETDALLCKSHLDANDMDYLVNKRGANEQYVFTVNRSDQAQLKRVMLDVAIDKQSECKDIYNRELTADSQYRMNMLERLGSQNSENCDITIVDIDGTALIGDKKFISLQKEGQEISFINKKKDIRDMNQVFIKMKYPVALSRSEYREFLNADNREDFLIDKRREQGISAITPSDRDAILRHEAQKELIEQKLAQEHPNEIIADMNDYNNGQSLILFKEAERQNYELNHDMNEISNIDANILNDAFMEYRGYDIERPEVNCEKLADIENSIFNDVNERMEKIAELTAELNIDSLENDVSNEVINDAELLDSNIIEINQEEM